MLRRRWLRIVIYGGLILLIALGYTWRREIRHVVRNRSLPPPDRTVESVVAAYGARVRAEFEPVCAAKGIDWPPRRVRMLAFKRERMLEVWGANVDGPFAHLASFPILAASGDLGPKKREGDRQVPEGFYRLPLLNPMSSFHLSILVDYPNEEDNAHSTVPRSDMGGEIYIHGNAVSIGCLAMGDEAIEKIFCLTAWADEDHRDIIISPVDFRVDAALDLGAQEEEPRMAALYGRLREALAEYPSDAGGEIRVAKESADAR
jgi:hypothetical protein